MAESEMVIFTRRLLDAAFDLRERLEEANLRRGQVDETP